MATTFLVFIYQSFIDTSNVVSGQPFGEASKIMLYTVGAWLILWPVFIVFIAISTVKRFGSVIYKQASIWHIFWSPLAIGIIYFILITNSSRMFQIAHLY